MTDGKAAAFRQNYSPYGLACIDLRQLNSCPSDQYQANDKISGLVNTRLTAICKRIKNDLNITLWVISYGGGFDAADESRLGKCASPDHYYSADKDEDLIATFKQIASEIADLRLAS